MVSFEGIHYRECKQETLAGLRAYLSTDPHQRLPRLRRRIKGMPVWCPLSRYR